ncbi:MAG: tetratricopeptide repeat protein [Isosphaeraceae bacterium]
MPTTYNGIGTHYYGKKNLSVRTAACHSCRRVANLESYDTRLWFVVVFIPLIPLGRKRILDKCPLCTRHFAVDADSFEQSRQLEISGSMEQYRRAPTPESALQAHAQLLGFRDFEQAAEFRQTILGQFPGHAVLRAGLASQLDQFAVHGEGAKLFEEALTLQPDLPEARVGVARRKMAAGELDEARKLLDFLEIPGAGRDDSLEPLDVLAASYQRKGRREEALSLARHLLSELPDLGSAMPFARSWRNQRKHWGNGNRSCRPGSFPCAASSGVRTRRYLPGSAGYSGPDWFWGSWRRAC